ncbi:hypothetical protein AmDm5_0863 [Acetobacter malorum]|nr:hypothetical protein AmDm5_0863 [Acetobacter malorum]
MAGLYLAVWQYFSASALKSGLGFGVILQFIARPSSLISA